MRALLAAVAVTAVGLATTGCLQAPVVPPTGIIYSGVQAPLDYENAQSQVAPSLKQGRASSHNILGLVAYGDSSLEAAAAQGNITTAHTADYDYLNVLYVYQRYTTVVRGE